MRTTQYGNSPIIAIFHESFKLMWLCQDAGKYIEDWEITCSRAEVIGWGYFWGIKQRVGCKWKEHWIGIWKWKAGRGVEFHNWQEFIGNQPKWIINWLNSNEFIKCRQSCENSICVNWRRFGSIKNFQKTFWFLSKNDLK